MSTAWSIPVFMEDLVTNPGPLLVYDRLYLDEPAYEQLCDFLDPPYQQFMRACVESERLGLFRLFSADSELLQGDDFSVQVGSSDLLSDAFFIQTVGRMVDTWGEYAAPTAFSFEAMNIPTMEVIAKRLSRRLRKVSIVDHVERALLYRISGQKKLSRAMVLPHVSRIAIELAPKFFHAAPHRETWDVDDVIRLRENEHWRSYRHQMSSVADEFLERIEELFRDPLRGQGIPGDVVQALRHEMVTVQEDLYSRLTDAFEKLRNHVAVNTWSVLGGILGISAPLVGAVDPVWGISLGVAGGATILADQMRAFLQRRSCEWVDFMSFVARGSERKTMGMAAMHEFTRALIAFEEDLGETRQRLHDRAHEPKGRSENLVQDELGRLGDLVDRYKARSRSLLFVLSLHRFELRLHRRLLVQPVCRAVAGLRNAAERRNVSICVDRPSIEELPPVRLDDEAFQMVLDVLLDNAIKYSEPSTRVRVRGELGERGVVLEFENVGIALKPQDLEMIFEKGGRTREAVGRDAGGMGLGLFIGRKIAELHGGTLTAEASVQCRGGYRTRFRLQLPA